VDDNCCIRVFADLPQIERCRERIRSMDESITGKAAVLGLAGNAVRLKILHLLHEEGKLCPCDLSDVLGMNVSAVSQHLRKLKDGKLVETKRAGQTIFYSVTQEFLSVLKPLLNFSPTGVAEKGVDVSR
jgi:DNA-binding transcriptional ArsR family regulator